MSLRTSRAFLSLFGGLATLFTATTSLADEVWGKDYFPNVPLQTEEGKTIRFFDDVVKGKIVVINFVYTSCPDTCPLETAQLVKVQEILGDRLGKDIFIYSISLDPKTDTPAVLKAYKEKFGAKWTFLTGSIDDTWAVQKKLGLFLEEIKDGLNNHNVNMIIGNQRTGRWMKRSPFENPYVLADQIGNWLDGWKRPPELDGYENAPKLRDLPRGEQLFRTRCASCHSMVGKDPERALGPDLLGVTQRREKSWLLNWLRAPDEMLKKKDPIAIALFYKYNKLAMPNLRLNQEEAMDILRFLDDETTRLVKLRVDPLAKFAIKTNSSPTARVSEQLGRPGKAVNVLNSWIRQAHPSTKINQSFLTLVNKGSDDVTLTGIQSDAFGSGGIYEMSKVNGRMSRKALDALVIPAGEQAVLKPGGIHLLLRDRNRKLAMGEQISINLIFKSGIHQVVQLEVADR